MKLGRIMTGQPMSRATAIRLVDVAREARFGHGESDLGHRRLEQLPVLGGGDRLGSRADDLDAEALGDAASHEFHRQVEGRLSPQGR